MAEGGKGRAVVTGGSSGIGLAIAQRLAADGFSITIIGRNEQRLEEVRAKIATDADFLVADVSSGADVRAMALEAKRRYGEIAALVNNAGIMKTTSLSTPADELEQIFDETLAINLKGALLVTHALAPLMRSPGGRVVNLSSTVSYNGGSVPGLIAYSASKAGINGMTMALARELAPRDITVNAVAPGMIDETGLTGTFDEARRERIKAMLPLRRPGQPNEVAAAVSYLVSADAGYVTGTVMSVNGGWIFR